MVVVELGHKAHLIFSAHLETSCRQGIRHIRKCQILALFPVGRKTDHHHIVGIGREEITAVTHALTRKTDRHQSRIKRQGTRVSADFPLIKSRGDTELSGSRKTSEAERSLGIRLIRHPAVEIVLGKACRLFRVPIQKRLAYFLQHVCRLLVHVPIIVRASGGVRSPTPQALLIERETLLAYRTEHIRPDASVAYGKRHVFPLPVLVHHSASFRGRHFSLAPYRQGVRRTRLIKPNDLPAFLCGKRSGQP